MQEGNARRKCKKEMKEKKDFTLIDRKRKLGIVRIERNVQEKETEITQK